MNNQEYLLLCLAEECAEVAHRVSKALRFGLDELQREQLLNNRDRLRGELHDLSAIVELLYENGVDVRPVDWSLISKKKEKVLRYMLYSRDLGTLVED